MGFMQIRGETKQRIHVSEINVLIIESTAVSLTTNLLNELIKNKVKVIFCDENHNPSSELAPYYGSHDTSRALKKQMNWSQLMKDLTWQRIIRSKISNQAIVLQNLGKLGEAELLLSYVNNVEPADKTNREGHAAKVYFNALFDEEFVRRSGGIYNAALDYGYSIILAIFNREIVAKGKITQLGIWHDNVFNQFNLSSDLMEPFRPLVDMFVINMEFPDVDAELNPELKHQLLRILESEVQLDNKNYKLTNAISIYTKRVLDALDDGILVDIQGLRYG